MEKTSTSREVFHLDQLDTPKHNFLNNFEASLGSTFVASTCKRKFKHCPERFVESIVGQLTNQMLVKFGCKRVVVTLQDMFGSPRPPLDRNFFFIQHIDEVPYLNNFSRFCFNDSPF